MSTSVAHHHGIYELYGVFTSASDSRLKKCAYFGSKGIGKPCTGKLYARFDEGGLVLPALYPIIFWVKSAGLYRNHKPGYALMSICVMFHVVLGECLINRTGPWEKSLVK